MKNRQATTESLLLIDLLINDRLKFSKNCIFIQVRRKRIYKQTDKLTLRDPQWQRCFPNNHAYRLTSMYPHKCPPAPILSPSPFFISFVTNIHGLKYVISKNRKTVTNLWEGTF